MIVVVCIPMASINLTSNDHKQFDPGNDVSLFSRISIGTHGSDPSTYDSDSKLVAILTLNSTFLLIIMVWYLCMHVLQARLTNQIDEDVLTPSDFTAMAFNVPQDVSQKELKQWLKTEHGLSGVLMVVY